jgi:hypothetical protein
MKQIDCTEIEGISNLNLNLKFKLSLDYSSYYKIENHIKFLSPSLLVQRSIIESVRDRMEDEYK